MVPQCRNINKIYQSIIYYRQTIYNNQLKLHSINEHLLLLNVL